MSGGLGGQDLETLYENLAQMIDAAGPENEVVALTKLALLLAEEIGDPQRVAALMARAGEDLDP